MLAVILVATFALYAPTLADWFTGDDFWFLRASQQHSLGSSVRRALDFRLTGAAPEFDRYRPLYPITWRLEYALFGLNAAYYHAVVIALHLACVAVAWFIARRLLSLAWAANLATLIFALHPVYADAVAWISGGNRVFATLPYLLSLLLFMRYHDASRASRPAAYLASLALFVVAVLYHSSALTLAAVLPLYVFVVEGEPRDALRWRQWIQFVPFLAFAGVLSGIQYWVRGHAGADQAFQFGWRQYAVYGNYFGMAVVPVEPSGHGHTLNAAIDALQGFGSIALIAVAIFLFWSRSRLGAFAALWFCVSLLPDSTLTLGAFGRVIHAAGLPLALLLVAALLELSKSLPAQCTRPISRAAPYLVIAAILPVMIVGYGRERGTSHDASRDERFAAALRREAQSAPPGATLYVVGAPANLVLFGSDSRVQSLTHLYVSNVNTKVVTAAQATQIASTLAPGDRIFRYQP